MNTVEEFDEGLAELPVGLGLSTKMWGDSVYIFKECVIPSLEAGLSIDRITVALSVEVSLDIGVDDADSIEVELELVVAAADVLMVDVEVVEGGGVGEGGGVEASTEGGEAGELGWLPPPPVPSDPKTTRLAELPLGTVATQNEAPPAPTELLPII